VNPQPPYRCEDIPALLEDYLDQELTHEATLPMLQHLETCQICAAWCQQRYQALAEMRHAVQDFTVPATLLARLSGALAPDTE
jgi:anti-sigma factor RsiW